MSKHQNGLPYGTTRRAPRPSFAHAILLDQGRVELSWLIVDVYGPMEMVSDAAVEDWPIVYMPVVDELWEDTEVQQRDGCYCQVILYPNNVTHGLSCHEHWLD